MSGAPTSPDRSPPERPTGDTAAAELALGVLDAPEREAAEARAASDPDFAATAAAWSARLHALSEVVAPVEPGPELWSRIEAALGAPATAPVDAAVPKPQDGRVVQIEPRRRERQWRRLAGLATGLAAACVVAVVLLLARRPVVSAPLLTARLEPPAGEALLADAALYTATVDRTRRTVVLTAVGPGPVDPRARELWVVAKPGPPLPVGVIARDKPLALPREAADAVRSGAVLAVSLEPAGGSPTGAPTGPVIATGVLAGA